MPLFRGNIGNIFPVDVNNAAACLLEPGNEAQNCGFPAPRRAQQRYEFAIFNGQVYIFKRAGIAKIFGNSFKLDNMLWCHDIYPCKTALKNKYTGSGL